MAENTKRSILVSHVYSSNNNGDAAILSAQISELQRVFPGAKVCISTIDRIVEGYTFDDVPVVEALMYGAVAPGRSKVRKLLCSAGMLSYTSLWALLRRGLDISLPVPKTWRRPLEALDNADLEVCVGGGYLRAKEDLTSTIILLLLVHQIRLARILGKPVYLYAQSFGPYHTTLQRRIARWGIQSASLVLVREAKSRKLLSELGIPDARVTKVPDSAFLFSAKPNKAVAKLVRPHGDQETVVGITVRSWLDEARQTAYEWAMAALIRDIAARPHYRVVVIPQVTSTEQHDDDREAGARIAAHLQPADNIVFLNERFSHRDILSAYASLDYLVGTRFHSVIFALLSNVPAIAIEYEHKTSGIMLDLGLEEWVIPIEDVTAERLTKLFATLLKRQKSYHEKLCRVVPEYIVQAGSAAERIAADFGRNKT